MHTFLGHSLNLGGGGGGEGREGGSRGHWPGEHSGYGYPEVHLQKMELGCSPQMSAHEASGQKSECHSIILDFNSSSSNHHTEKFWLLALLLLFPSTHNL